MNVWKYIYIHIKEVRQELSERPRYWKRAIAVYWAAIVAAVVAVNVRFYNFAGKWKVKEENKRHIYCIGRRRYTSMTKSDILRWPSQYYCGCIQFHTVFS